MGQNKITQPYTNTVISTNTVVREFTQDTEPMSLVWHQDNEDRTITVLEGQGWQIQKDNELPLASLHCASCQSNGTASLDSGASLNAASFRTF